ncbi:UNVERIFIED_CONTAM: hypothetical protein HHA_217000 [Hammondia hammondi]|eukprot:XP_008886439.1 hypothetical protein HHA_217000 [Hammondia hammondi]
MARGKAKAKAASAAKKRNNRDTKKADRDRGNAEDAPTAAETHDVEETTEAKPQTERRGDCGEEKARKKHAAADEGPGVEEEEDKKKDDKDTGGEKETGETVRRGDAFAEGPSQSVAEAGKCKETPKDTAVSDSPGPATSGVHTPETSEAAAEESQAQVPDSSSENSSQQKTQQPRESRNHHRKDARKEPPPPRFLSLRTQPGVCTPPPPPPGAPLILSAPQRQGSVAPRVFSPQVPPPPLPQNLPRSAAVPPPSPSSVLLTGRRLPPPPPTVSQPTFASPSRPSAPAFRGVSPAAASPPFQQRTLEGAMDPFAQLAYFTLLQQQREESEKLSQEPPALGGTDPSASRPSLSSAESKSSAERGAAHASDGASVAGAPSVLEVGSTYTGLSTTSHFGLYSEPEMLRRIEAARDYEEVRSLVNMYSEKAKKFPSVLGALLLRLALLGRQVFRDQLLEMSRALMRNAGVLEQEAARKAMKDPLPGSTLGSLERNPQEDVKFSDFTETTARLSDCLTEHLRTHASRVSNDVLQNLLWALSLTQTNCMHQLRELAGFVSVRQDLSASQLVTLFCAYTRGLEKTSDRRGGVNVTSDDSSFLEDCVQKLLLRPEELSSLTPKQIALFLQACTRLNFNNSLLLKHVGKLSLQKEKEFAPKEWATVVAVFTRFGVPLRGECEKLRRERRARDWERPPPPKKPKPISQC